jgi:hypothetical protein
MLDTRAKTEASSPESLDIRRCRRWKEESILFGGGSAGATQSVLGQVHTLGNRTRRSVPDGGARVPEVFPAAKLEGLVAGVADHPRATQTSGRPCCGQ